MTLIELLQRATTSHITGREPVCYGKKANYTVVIRITVRDRDRLVRALKREKKR